MSRRSAWRLGPIARVSMGLTALVVSLVLVADVLLDLLPNQDQLERRTRQRVAENLAIQLTGLLVAGDEAMIGKTIQLVLARDPDMRAISVRREDGLTALRRSHAVDSQVVGAASTANRLRVPIMSGQRVWGEVEVQFAADAPATARSWLSRPAIQMVAVLGIGGFLLFYVYLRRAMRSLDPSAAVPDRVRKAFDTLTEGVVILDQHAHIVLANDAFRQLHPNPDDELNGQRLDAQDWLTAGRQAQGGRPPPWVQTLERSVTVEAEPLTLARANGPDIRLVVTSAPIGDSKGRARGCMVTFTNVSAVHQVNDELRSTLDELQRSREHIETQNLELRLLATRDSLTGCLNRRAFFELAGNGFDAAQRTGGAMSCVMADIDHFKQFNDRYGHGVGDQVIRAVAQALGAGMRQQDILGRYGGEEFCIFMPGLTPDEALAACEAIRVDIERHAHQAVRGTDVTPITSSFGVASRDMGARTLEELIDQADQALYAAKQAGRNRVLSHQRVEA